MPLSNDESNGKAESSRDAVNIAECHIGSQWWIPHPKHVWARAKALSAPLAAKVSVQILNDVTGEPLESEDSIEVEVKDLLSYDAVDFSSVTNLAQLNRIGEAELLATLRTRFAHDNIYTMAGSTLLSTNPYKQLNLFSSKVIDEYKQSNHANKNMRLPHVYAIADDAYKRLVKNDNAQAIIISGDSGSGKTEAAKFVLQYLTQVSSSTMTDKASMNANHSLYQRSRRKSSAQRRSSIAQMFVPGSNIELKVMESNPLLEAFGNAQTLRNNNSSRFGKFLQLYFNAGQITGAQVQYFLLERSRLISHQAGERSFHIFYTLCGGASDEICAHVGVTRACASVSNGVTFRYLCTDETSQASPRSKDSFIDADNEKEEFEDVVEAMKNFEINEEERLAVFSLLSAVLHLGNLEFVDNEQDHAEIVHDDDNKNNNNNNKNDDDDDDDDDETKLSAPQHPLDWIAKLISIDKQDVREALIARRVGRENIYVPLNAVEASSARHALAKEIYSRIFRWLVSKINSSLAQRNNEITDERHLGILDIFGFEKFENNGFEQICINYTNEMLQNLFVSEVLRESEQALYASEGIEWEPIQLEHAGLALSLLDSTPNGLLRILDDECKLKTGSVESFIHRLSDANADCPVFVRLERRRLSEENVFEIVHYAGVVAYDSSHFLIKNRDRCTESLLSLLRKPKLEIYQQILQSMDGNEDTSDEVQAMTPMSRPKTGQFIAGRFRMQLSQLVSTLRSSGVHFIRCIKPNSLMSSIKFDSNLIMQQLSNAGIIQLVRIRNAGYPVRISKDDFTQRYCIKHENIEEFLKKNQSTSGQYQIGHTLLFLRRELHNHLEDNRVERLSSATKIIQTYWRRNLAQSLANRRRRALLTMQTSLHTYIAAMIFVRHHRLQSANVLQAAFRARKLCEHINQRRIAIACLQAALLSPLVHYASQQLLKKAAKRQTHTQSSGRESGKEHQVKSRVEIVTAEQGKRRSSKSTRRVTEIDIASLNVDERKWPNIAGVEPMSITKRLMVAVFTGDNFASSIKSLLNMLKKEYSGTFRLYNLCVESGYKIDPTTMLHLPFSGHSPCPFHMLTTFCLDLRAWLQKSPDNIAVVHSKAGKGRSSMVACAHLIHEKVFPNAHSSLSYFWDSRSGTSVESSMTPSQCRYVKYYEMYIHQPRSLDQEAAISKVQVSGFTFDSTPKDNELWLMVAKGVSTGKAKQKWVRVHERNASSCRWTLRTPISVSGDIKIEVLSRKQKGKVAKVLMYCCFHVSFVSKLIVFTKEDIDKAFKDTTHIKFSKDLRIEIELTSFSDSDDTLRTADIEPYRDPQAKLSGNGMDGSDAGGESSKGAKTRSTSSSTKGANSSKISSTNISTSRILNTPKLIESKTLSKMNSRIRQKIRLDSMKSIVSNTHKQHMIKSEAINIAQRISRTTTRIRELTHFSSHMKIAVSSDSAWIKDSKDSLSVSKHIVNSVNDEIENLEPPSKINAQSGGRIRQTTAQLEKIFAAKRNALRAPTSVLPEKIACKSLHEDELCHAQIERVVMRRRRRPAQNVTELLYKR